jgi:hypothetical protein
MYITLAEEWEEKKLQKIKLNKISIKQSKIEQ